jgi:hypothetical protein
MLYLYLNILCSCWRSSRTYKGNGTVNSSHFEVEADGIHGYHHARY